MERPRDVATWRPSKGYRAMVFRHGAVRLIAPRSSDSGIPLRHREQHNNCSLIFFFFNTSCLGRAIVSVHAYLSITITKTTKISI